MRFVFPEMIFIHIQVLVCPWNGRSQVTCSPLHRARFSLALSPGDLAGLVVFLLYKTRARA